MDPYSVLEVERGCSEAEIQRAYKKQCLRWHPDKNRDNEEEAKKRFILAKEAFQLLFDKTSRADYDRKQEETRVREQRQRERHEKANGERKRLIEDLERREDDCTEKRPRGGTVGDKKKEEEKARESFEEMRRRLEKEVNEEMKQQLEKVSRLREESAAAATEKTQLKTTEEVVKDDEKKEKGKSALDEMSLEELQEFYFANDGR